MISANIFKSYDIRGIYPSELDEEAAYLIGGAFVNYTKAKKVVIGRDMRLSSPSLFKALCRGITEAGSDVYDTGEIITELLYFAMGFYGYDAGIMITASHNPKEYNGFKMMKREGSNFLFIRGKNLADLVVESSFKNISQRGVLKEIDIWQDYIKHCFSFADTKSIKPFNVVIDAGNGMWGKFIPMIKNKLPIKIIPLNFELDGNFPNHPSNPLGEGAINQISRAIRKEGADFGFIFDGDGDRIFLIDEKGSFIKGDMSFLLMAKWSLEKNPGAVFSYNLVCSKAVPELITKWGGRAIRTPVGFVNVREATIKNNGVMGGETSGHYCFRDNYYGDSAFMALLTLLNIISESSKTVSMMIAEVYPYAKADDINFQIADKDSILQKVKERYSNGEQDFLDGITVRYNDWWFNLRASNTEPIIRLTIEANTEELLNQKQKEITDFINS